MTYVFNEQQAECVSCGVVGRTAMMIVSWPDPESAEPCDRPYAECWKCTQAGVPASVARRFTDLTQRLREDEPHLSDVIDKCTTRQAAADAAGVQVRTVYNWLAGRTEPNFWQGLALCKLAGVDPFKVHRDDAA